MNVSRTRYGDVKRQQIGGMEDDESIVPHSTVSGYVQKGFFYRAILKDVSQDIDDNGMCAQPPRKALATRIQMANLPALLIPAEREEFVTVRVAYIDNVSRYFVQLEENGPLIIKMMAYIRNLEAEKMLVAVKNAEAGTVVLARFAGDGSLYRASVVSKVSMLKMRVFFMDYGNLEEVPVSDIYTVKDEGLLEVAPQAICVRLQDVHMSVLSRRRFTEAILDRTVGIQILSVDSNNESFTVKMYTIVEGKEINIEDVLSGKCPLAPPYSSKVPNSELIEFSSTPNSGTTFATKGYNRLSHLSRDCPQPKSGRREGVNRSSEECFNCHEMGHISRDCPKPRRGRWDDRGQTSGSMKFGSGGSENNVELSRGSGEFGFGTAKREGHGGMGARGFTFPRNFGGDVACRDHKSSDGERRNFGRQMCDTESGRERFNVFKDAKRHEVYGFGVSSGKDANEDRPNGNFHGGFHAKGDDGLQSAEAVTSTIQTNEVTDSGGLETLRQEGKRNEAKQVDSSEASWSGRMRDKSPDVSLLSNPGQPSSFKQQKVTAIVGNEVVQRIEPPNLGTIDMGERVEGMRSDDSTTASPASFFVQLFRDDGVIKKLSLDQMPQGSRKVTSPRVSMVCMAPFYMVFYRAEIVSIAECGRCEVLFVDYGNREVVSAEELYLIDGALPELIRNSPRMAFECRLADVMPFSDVSQFDAEVCNEFSKLMQGELNICFLQKSIKNIYDVTVRLTDGRNVSNILCESGYAIPLSWRTKSVTAFEECKVMRSDDTDNVQDIFTVQFISDFDNLEKLSSAYAPYENTIRSPCIGDIAIATFEDFPYRAEIIGLDIGPSSEEEPTKRIYRLRYVDFGNECLKEANEIFAVNRDEQPEVVLSLPTLGIRCHLVGIQPYGNGKDKKTGSWSQAALRVLNDALPPGAEVIVLFGHPDEETVYPVKVKTIMKETPENNIEKEAGQVECVGKTETVETERHIDLAKLLLEKGFAELSPQTWDFPTANLLALGSRQVDIRIVGCIGTTLFMRPIKFDTLYDTLKKALTEVVLSPVESGIATGLIQQNGEYKRVKILMQETKAIEPEPLYGENGEEVKEREDGSLGTASKVNNLTKAIDRKYFLVDEGKIMEESDGAVYEVWHVQPINFSGNDSNFIVRTCHKLAIPFRFSTVQIVNHIDEPIMEQISRSIALAKIRMQLKGGEVLVDDVTMAGGTSLVTYLLECGVAKKVEDSEKAKPVSGDFGVLDSNVDNRTSFGEDVGTASLESTSFFSSEPSYEVSFAPPSALRGSPSPDLEIRHSSPFDCRRHRASESASDDNSSTNTNNESKMTDHSDMESQDKPARMDWITKDFHNNSTERANTVSTWSVMDSGGVEMVGDEKRESNNNPTDAGMPMVKALVGAKPDEEKEKATGDEGQPNLAVKQETFIVEEIVSLIQEQSYVENDPLVESSLDGHLNSTKLSDKSLPEVHLYKAKSICDEHLESNDKLDNNPGKRDVKPLMMVSELISIVDSGLFDEDRVSEHPTPAEIAASRLLEKVDETLKEDANIIAEVQEDNQKDKNSKEDGEEGEWVSKVQLLDE